MNVRGWRGSLVLLAAWLSLPARMGQAAPDGAAGTFSGALRIDQDMTCRILNGRDTDDVTCSVDRDPRYNMPRVTLRFPAFALKAPPSCTVTGHTPQSGSVGEGGRQGSLPVLTGATTTAVTMIFNGIPVLPCACGTVAHFVCSIAN